MLTLEEWMEIKDLEGQGHSIREIARLSGGSRNTVRRQFRDKKPLVFATPVRSSKLDSFKPYVEGRFRECGLSCVRLLEEIRPMGYEGSIDLLWRYVRTLAPEREKRQKLRVRFETPPGQQAQLD